MSEKAVHVAAAASLKQAVREIHVTAGLDTPATGSQAPILIGVTSPNFGEGKTTVAIALAGSLSTDFGATVMLIDGDFHTPSIAREYGMEGEAGLWEVATGTARLESAARGWQRSGLRVLSSGRAPGNPARFAHSAQLDSVLQEIKRGNRYVVMDLPAALHSMTTPALAKRCTGVVVVIHAAKTTVADLERTMHLLQGAPILGVVVNRSRSNVPRWLARMFSLKG